MGIYLKKDLPLKKTLKEVKFINKLSDKYVKIGILNLMPTLNETECQLIKALDNNMLDIELDFIYLDTKNKNKEKVDYFKKYYYSFKSIKNTYYDGMIVTGAPLEHINYNDVDYISELKEFFKYTKEHVRSTIFLCWASQVALQYFYGISRYYLKEKASGVYEHFIVNKTLLVKDFDDVFYIPVSRYCSIIEEDVKSKSELILTSKSNDTGLLIIESKDKSKVFLTGHAEYDIDTLDKEYKRDINKGLNPKVPKNYYLNDNPNNKPIVRWRAHGSLLYHNWLYYYVYKSN